MMRLTLMLAFLFVSVVTHAQLSVQKGLTAQQLGNNLAGANINIINPTITGDTSQYGLFNFTGTGLGLSSGVILSTGDIDNAVGPNSNPSTSTSYGLPGDADLTALAGFATQDAVVFEFEFEVQGDELEFNFVFLSEEYNEFVNSGFNDVFAFYISGPGIVGQENLAVVPGTTTPVTINSINNGSFFQFYNDNDASVTNQVNVEFDGFTTLMKARRTNLTPCSVYKLSLRIADGSDDRLDSGVLLQENSLVSNSIAVNSATVSTDTTALEGCIPATFTFNLGATAATDLNIPIRLGGTALNGVDYAFIDSIITIPAGQTSSTVIINALADGITEGRETIELYYSPSSCAPEDTVLLYIDDATSITFDALGTNLNCNGNSSGSINVNITGGAPPYNVTYIDTATGVSNTVPATSLPITGLDATSYLLRISDQYGCTADAIVVGGNFNAGQTFLPDGTGASYTSGINITGFNAGQTLNSINQINSICATMEHSYASDLTIELVAPSGQSIQLKNVGNTGTGVNTCDLGEPIASGPVDNWSTSNTLPGVGYQYCWTNNPTYATMNDMVSPAPPGPPPTHTFTTLAGNTYTDYYLPAGSYAPRQSFFGLLGTSLNGNWTLRVTDNFAQDNGYIFDWSISLQTDLPDSIVTLTEPPAPTMAHTTTDPACGMSNGAIDFSVTGNGPFTYLWSNGATTEDLNNITAGSYTVTVTDGTGCTYDYTVNLSNTGSVTLSAVVTDEACDGSNDGAIDLSVGAGTFTYAWSNSASTEDLTGLAPGTYTVTVSDGTCVGVASYTVDPASTIVVTSSITNENCGDQEGVINISLQGGVTPFTYIWSNGETSQDIDDLQQGNYFVTVTDANNCTTVDSFTVINLVGNCVPSCDLDITSFLASNENCADGTGAVDITVFTTSGPITYLWSNGATTQDISGLSAGSYAVTVTDAINCVDTMSFNIINQASGLSIASMNVTNEFCGNGSGAIDATISGGSLPYTYLWSNGATTQDLSNVAAGAYTLTVTDGNGCRYVDNATVVNNTGGFVQTFGNAVDEVCSNGQGSIDILFSGGQTPYSYLWSNGATTEDLIGISAGTYTCTVTDNAGCVLITPSYVVNNNAGGLTFNNIDVDNETCANGQGEITLSITGGQAPYTYAWNTGANTAAITGLSAGAYTATVTDNSGCAIFTNTLNLANNSGNLSLDAVQVMDETCGSGTGSVDITVSGNTGPLSFAWSNSSASEDLSNLSAGNYNCTITDSVGCAVYANATVNNDPGALSIDNTIISDETCGQNDGSVTIIVSGANAPATYAWSNASATQNLSNIAAGTYSVTVTDAIGCTVTSNANVQNNTGTLALAGQVLTNEVCGNGQGAIDISITGGTAPLTYLWSNNATTEDVSGLTSGTYTCTISDASGCDLIAGPYVINNSSGTLTQGTHLVTDETCGNGQGAIDITVTGGTAPLTYLWSNNATTEDLTNLSAGTYTGTVSDASGCSLIITRTVNNNAGGLTISNAQVVDENCTDGQGAIDITIAGGTPTYTYAWSNSATTEDLTTLSAGTYSVTVTDANGCAVSNSYTVNNNSANFQLANINTTNENCGDGTGAIDVTFTGGQAPLVYAWSNGATTEDLTGLNAGVYAATVTDANGCVITHSSSIQNDPGSLTVSNDSIVDATCGAVNGAVFLTISNGTPGYTYQWSNGATTQNLTGLSGGTYTCVITDANGCTTNYTGTVQDLGGNLQIANSSTVDDACNQGTGSITTTVTGGGLPYTYNWSTVSSNPCCNYELHMFDLNGNGWGGTPAPFVNVYVNNNLIGAYTVPIGPGNSFNSVAIPVCTGDIIAVEYVAAAQNGNNAYLLLNAAGDTVFQDGPNPFSGGIAYTGNVTCSINGQGTNSISNLSAGNYGLTVTDNYGCSVTQAYTINNSSGAINISLNNQVDETCGLGNGALDVTVGGAANPTYLWSNGATTEDITGLSAGAYTMTATDPSNGCTTVGSYTIVNNANGLVVTDTLVTNETCGNGQGAIDLTVSGGATPYSFAWSNGSGTEDIILLSAGTYIVTITDNTGCDLVETYTVINNANGITASAVTTDETCGDGTGAIDMTVTGGTTPYTFAWSNGATTEDITGLSAGIYNTTITDASGCVIVFADTVNNTTSTVTITNVTIDTAFCGNNDGGVTLALSGGALPLSFNWSNGATTQNLTNVTPGTYTLTITEANGCMLVDSFVVENNAFFDVTATVTNEACGDGTGAIDLTIAAGGPPPSFVWSTGATTEDLANLSAGTYSVTMTVNFGPGGGGCTHVETYQVINDLGPVNIDSLVVTDETCNQANGEIDAYTSIDSFCSYTLNLYDGFGFGWQGSSVTVIVNGVNVGNYTATAAVSSFTIKVPSGQSIQFIYNESPFAPGQDSYDVVLNGTTEFISGLNPVNGSGYTTTCTSPTTSVTSFTYLWSTGATTQSISALSAGTYTLSITDNNGCVTIDSVSIQNNTFGFGIAGALLTDEQCGDGTGAIDLTIGGGASPYTFVWSNGATTEDLTGLSAGSYDVTVTDNLGCALVQSYVINNNTNNFGVTGTTTAANCAAADGSVDITVTGGTSPYTYAWSNGATTEDVSAVVSGTYVVTITDAAGCIINATYTVGNTGGGLGLTSTPTAATCNQANGGMILNVTGGTSPYTYAWNNGATGASISGVLAGNYGATITDANGCQLSVPIVIPNIGTPVDFISGDTTSTSCSSCSDGAVDLTLGGAGAPYTFVWSNGATTEDLINVVPGVYNVTITNVDGCTMDTVFTVDFSTAIVELEGMELSVYPNPSNGSIYVEFAQLPMEPIQIEVFNALGQRVMERTYAPQLIQERIHVDVQNASTGTYMMKISSAGKYITKRVVILKE
ncbi:choice-of-anchor L domain-containing protein [Aureispira sp. CCB-E]|uniref:choice-of-anchor L domain-containing protein n=1 Tax=Aureispira sp. CCB-E TaxID=3051121 RepID=UPI002868B8BD|nr:choice-of-anchor L domain-containing protein [Aureispira sp. CCB-E]WMX16750.1 choice-of-anchor L domain-containing protein [Aureispira sp. CCB-E]